MIRSDINREEIMHQLQDSGTKFAITASGCCASLASWFTLYTGSSKSTVEAFTPYSKGAIDAYIGYEPAKYASQEVADLTSKLCFRAAQNIYMKEKDYNMIDREHTKYFGIGVTGVVASTRKISGGHRCFMSMYTDQGTDSILVKLTTETMSRVDQDLLLSDLFLLQIGLKVGLKLEEEYKNFLERNKADIQVCQEVVKKHDFLDLVVDGEAGNVVFWANGKITSNSELDGFIILAGAFNPVHQGHFDLAKLAAEQMGIKSHKIMFEIAINNADKGKIDRKTILERLAQFKERGLSVMLSNKTLFTHKNEHLTNGVFVLGHDTYKRLFDLRYYENSMEVMILKMGEFLRKKNKFVIFRRRDPNTGLIDEISSVPIPSIMRPLVTEMKDYLNDVSSTMLRAELAGKKAK